MRWGLIPFWAKNRSIGSRMINARAETVVDLGILTGHDRAFDHLIPRRIPDQRQKTAWPLMLATTVDGPRTRISVHRLRSEHRSHHCICTSIGCEHQLAVSFGFGLIDSWKCVPMDFGPLSSRQAEGCHSVPAWAPAVAAPVKVGCATEIVLRASGAPARDGHFWLRASSRPPPASTGVLWCPLCTSNVLVEGFGVWRRKLVE